MCHAGKCLGRARARACARDETSSSGNQNRRATDSRPRLSSGDGVIIEDKRQRPKQASVADGGRALANDANFNEVET